ncbi:MULTISPECIES: ATP-dependent DNA helicase RecG [unclassified Enterococcus]|uniref:ATP-dependent DNA helicase RecG n=1 Tax=unclassified Enterococcus TaxID=2608891 RepID=UPI001557F131|nr:MULTISPECIES: ATP-dependent DNA helicase RecG [unclassified Enterococcus]MBS7576924.1 ATP-dependent DNA helicase RecG [Enterococcus sp. MMGLQ5-2]MBS7584331.1 ATP-dependent DNA helicase RecG [Enterococcus sp. MMGLQ5-1]NPD12187.1 ATP-dependent DNA helicase RecG [Enterococcus sp. MMGLQ5-1]NPD36759.1 ATP-dependent DNA helicase RecG [Enterococcus sp. MMGLQ5-2]
MNLLDPVSVLAGVGPKKMTALATLGINTIQDLLLNFPFRYEDFASKSVYDLTDGEKAVLVGQVVTEPIVNYFGRKRNKLTFKIKQEDAVVAVSFFNQPYLKDKVAVNYETMIFGKWDDTRKALTGLKILGAKFQAGDFQGIYHTNKNVKQSELEKLVRQALDLGYSELFQEILPNSLLSHYHLMSYRQAVRALHLPSSEEEYHQAGRRMKYQELLLFQLRLQSIRYQDRQLDSGLTINYSTEAVNQLLLSLPFSLTKAQKRVLEEILTDLQSPFHMNRLLQGDVGSGKTVIAAIAMYASFTAGFQSALMVPTEILAIQHFESLQGIFGKAVKIARLTSGMKVKEKQQILAEIANGQVQMIIGTHAIIQEAVAFSNLGLVITDEQHRFGVNQRKIFREKGQNPDVLMMTATPIPRTLAITVYGEMDVSIIDELPAGRLPIQTRWVKHEVLPKVLSWLQKELNQGHQAYFISPLIEESEQLDLKNATELYEELSQFYQGKARVALLHGKLKNDEKDAIMQAFKAHQIDILVSTTVIEVGVNVPNATVMVIMDADRFGLAQLHQLRGRIGRGEAKSYAILVANPKTKQGKERLTIMTEVSNGFILAQKDLEMRGAGEVFGLKQSGLPEFLVADIVNDGNILEAARQDAEKIWQIQSWQEKAEFHGLVRTLNESKQSIFD